MRKRVIIASCLALLAAVSVRSAQPQAQPGFSPARLMFGGNGWRQCPTSGVLTGTYQHHGPWVQTGPITANAARLYFDDAYTFNNTVTVTPGIENNAAGLGVASFISGVGDGWMPGQGPGAGGPRYTYSATEIRAGGGGHGGAGGGSVSGVNFGGQAYSLEQQLSGSAGGYDGDDGGGGLYIEGRGTGTFTASCAIHADGVAGPHNGSGSGGGVDVRNLGPVTLANGCAITADGPDCTSLRGGAGAGGIISVASLGGVTNSAGGGIHANGGNGQGAADGAPGIVDIPAAFRGPRLGNF